MARMHEILGVETGQRFWIKTAEGFIGSSTKYFLDGAGGLWRDLRSDIVGRERASMEELVAALNHGVVKKTEYTPEILEKLKALKTLGFKWLTTDESKREWAYDYKPVRGDNSWLMDMRIKTVYKPEPPLGLTSWADPEPLSIDAAIKEAEGTK